VPERSTEIEQILRDTVDAIARSDLDEMGRLTSRDDCVLTIGSDAGEWCEGHDQIMQLFRDSTPEGALGIAVGLDEVTAFREGSVRSGRLQWPHDGRLKWTHPASVVVSG